MMSSDKSVFLHVDMDAFFASVEQRDHPEYQGKPLVVGSPPDKRGVISASSYEARKFGIYSAMPSSLAYQKCPHAIFVPVNMKRYQDVSRQIFSLFERYTPYVEPLSIDEAFLDVSGSLHFFGQPQDIARKIKEDVRRECGLTASVGVAHNKSLAKLASDLDKPDGLTMVPTEPEEIVRFLAPLDVGRIWGVGRVLKLTLQKKGILKVGDLQRWSLEALTGLVGEHTASHLWNLAHGRDERSITLSIKEKSLSREYTFNEDCSDEEEIIARLKLLVADVGRRLRKKKIYAYGVQLKIRWSGFETITRQMSLEEGCCDDFRLYEKAMLLFKKVKMKKAVRLIGFGANRLSDTDKPHQLSLFDREYGPDKKRCLSETMDRIREDYGDDSIRLL